VQAHEAYHRSLHTPRERPESALWLELAFLNYSAFMGFGWASMMLDLMKQLETAPDIPADDPQLHLQHAWTIDSVLARISSALDAVAGGLRGLLSEQHPLDVKYFFERLIDKGKWQFALRPNAAAEAARYVPLLLAAMNDLAEFRLYRNKTVHTAFLVATSMGMRFIWWISPESIHQAADSTRPFSSEYTARTRPCTAAKRTRRISTP
jgi:hypothetical protein